MLPWRPDYEAPATVHRLAPGDAPCVPHAAPHWVRAGSRPSVSLSLTWHSHWSVPTGESLAVNPLSRAAGLGLSRAPVSARRDRRSAGSGERLSGPGAHG